MKATFYVKKRKSVPYGSVYDGELLHRAQMRNDGGLVKAVVVHKGTF